jgi:aspartate oxidase
MNRSRAGSHPYDVVIIGSGIGGLTAGLMTGKIVSTVLRHRLRWGI